MILQTLSLIAVIIFLFLESTKPLVAVEEIMESDDLTTAKLISSKTIVLGDNSVEDFQGLTVKKIDNTNRLKQLLLEIKELRKKYDPSSVDSSQPTGDETIVSNLNIGKTENTENQIPIEKQVDQGEDISPEKKESIEIEKSKLSEVNSQTNNSKTITKNNDLSTSDTGAQRPVSLNDNDISGFLGFDSRYFYRSNPLFVNGDLREKSESDVWTNNFYTGAFSTVEADNSAYTPFLSASYTTYNYLTDDLETFNYRTTSIATGIFSYYGGKNTYFAKVVYNMDKSTEFRTEDFNEFFSQIGLIRSFQFLDRLNANTTVGIGKHTSTIDSANGTRHEDQMDNWEIYALNIFSFENSFFENLLLTYRISYQSFDNGNYSDRRDLSHSFSGDYGFSFFDSDEHNLYLFLACSVRNSNKDSFDYVNVDTGGGLKFTANF